MIMVTSFLKQEGVASDMETGQMSNLKTKVHSLSGEDLGAFSFV